MAWIYDFADERRIISLIDPAAHNTPFAIAVELLQPASLDSAATYQHYQDLAPSRPTEPAYELRYVLQGAGKLTKTSSPSSTDDLDGPENEEEEYQLVAGDTILSTAGVTRCQAYGDHESNDPLLGLASLVVYVPHSVVEPAIVEQTNEASTSGSTTTTINEHNASHALLENAWGRGYLTSQTTTVSAELAGRLLSGAQAAAKHALSQSNTQMHPSHHQPRTADNNKMHIWGSVYGHTLRTLQNTVAWVAHTVQKLQPFHQNKSSRMPTMLKHLADLTAFRLPNQTNRLALVFDPLARPPVPFVFGVEIFEKGHLTTAHLHPTAHEVFFILSGSGEAFCDNERFSITAGDVVCFKPGSVHGIDNGMGSKMYCLELMLPNEHFAELVRQGEQTGGLLDEDLCILAHIGCS